MYLNITMYFSFVNEWKSLYRINSQNGLKQEQFLLPSFSCLVKEKAAWKIGDFGYHCFVMKCHRKWTGNRLYEVGILKFSKVIYHNLSFNGRYESSYDKLKGSSNPNHFFLKFNVGWELIRHIPILNLNILSILSRSRNS